MRRFASKIREYVPLFSLIVFIITLISLIIYLIFINNTGFADYFNYNVTAPTRAVMAWLMVIFPFSVAELFLVLSPIIIAILIVLAVKFGKRSSKSTIKFFSVLVSVLCFLFITFVWTFSSGYYTTPIDEKLELNTEGIGKSELKETADIIISNLNELSKYIEYDESNASIMPYSYDEMSKRICVAYEAFAEKYDILKSFDSRIKPIALSEPMTYTHISGVYTFMTGEANVNVNYPDFVVASSSAHEMAHQRGIARENEANFVSFLVLSESEDHFLKYSAYLDVYGYVLNALYSEDKELYLQAVSNLDAKVRNDRISYSEFFKKYQDSTMSEVADKVNNSYLQANGQQAGTRSYGMVTELACAYLTKEG